MVSRRLVEETKKSFIKNFNTLCGGKYSRWQVWSDFVYITAIAISNRVYKPTFEEREAEYFKIISKYDKGELGIFPKLIGDMVNSMDISQEQDFLGELFMQLELGNKNNGQFFTPYNVCKLMASVIGNKYVERIEEEGYIAINDPACGAGATLIAAISSVQEEIFKSKKKIKWQDHLLVTGQDIDMITALMCYIQLSFLGCAGYVKIANTLTDPMISKDDTTNYWFTPMYFSDTWHYRRIFHGTDWFMNKQYKPKKKEPTEETQVVEIKAKEVEVEIPQVPVISVYEVEGGQLSLF